MFGGGKKFDPDTDISDLSGKTILVTGGKITFRFDCPYSGQLLILNSGAR